MNLEQAIKDEVEKFDDRKSRSILVGGLLVILDYPPHDMVLDEEAVKKFLSTSLHSIHWQQQKR